MSSRHAKQVRFAPQNTVYPPEWSISAIALSFSPGSLSSRSSNSSSDSSKENGPPGPYVFLPRQQLSEPLKSVDRHPFLELSAITYDLRDPVSTARTTCDNHWLSIESLHQSAFTPFLSHLTIISSYLPWTIKVNASNASYITPQDIFTSIHSFFRTNITPTEFQLLPSHHHRKRATRAYQQRYRRLRLLSSSKISGNNVSNKASQLEKHAGMKRIDFLMGYTKFLGISNKGCRSNDEWHLQVAPSTMEL